MCQSVEVLGSEGVTTAPLSRFTYARAIGDEASMAIIPSSKTSSGAVTSDSQAMRTVRIAGIAAAKATRRARHVLAIFIGAFPFRMDLPAR